MQSRASRPSTSAWTGPRSPSGVWRRSTRRRGRTSWDPGVVEPHTGAVVVEGADDADGHVILLMEQVAHGLPEPLGLVVAGPGPLAVHVPAVGLRRGDVLRRGIAVDLAGRVEGQSADGFLTHFQQELGVKKVICLDNFQVGCPAWLKALSGEGRVELHRFNVITDDIANIPGAADVDYIYHMASIASPIFYRKYPIETLDANIWGLRRLLDFYCEKQGSPPGNCPGR